MDAAPAARTTDTSDVAFSSSVAVTVTVPPPSATVLPCALVDRVNVVGSGGGIATPFTTIRLAKPRFRQVAPGVFWFCQFSLFAMLQPAAAPASSLSESVALACKSAKSPVE